MWGHYLNQMYTTARKDVNSDKWKVADFRWFNFGVGRHWETGQITAHPGVVWLYKVQRHARGVVQRGARSRMHC